MDADLAKALAQAMGLKADVKNVTFDSIIPGLAANKYDLGMSSFTITKEREKTVDFVTYASRARRSSSRPTAARTSSRSRTSAAQKVAAERGTTQAADATAQDKKCKAAGKPGVTRRASTPTRTASTWRCRAAAPTSAMADSPPAAYAVEQSNGQFKLSGKQYGVGGLRDRDAEEQRPGEAGARRPEGRDGGRHLQADLHYWGLDAKTATSGCPCTITNPQINPTNVPAS